MISSPATGPVGVSLSVMYDVSAPPRSTCSAKSSHVVGALQLIRVNAGALPFIGALLVQVTLGLAKLSAPLAGVAACVGAGAKATAAAIRATAGRSESKRRISTSERLHVPLRVEKTRRGGPMCQV